MAKGEGIHAVFESSQELFDVTGLEEGKRSDFVKAVWVYATENDLKKSKAVKGRNTGGIQPDALLKKVYGAGWISLGGVTKGLKEHLS